MDYSTYGGCKVCICASPEIPLSTGNGTCRMSMRAIPATLRHCGVGARPVLCVARCSHSHRQQNKVMKIRGQLRSGAAAQHSLQACSSTVDSTDGSGTGILSGYCPATTHPPPTVLLLLPASKTSVRAERHRGKVWACTLTYWELVFGHCPAIRLALSPRRHTLRRRCGRFALQARGMMVFPERLLLEMSARETN